MQAIRVWETVAIFLAIAVAAASADARVTLFTFSSGLLAGQTSAQIDAGSTVSFRCRDEYNITRRAPMVSLRRSFPNATSHIVSNSEQLTEAFEGSNIAVAGINTEPNGVDVFEWTITNARVGDSGIYVCFVGSGNATSRLSISLNVTAEPSALGFYINDELQPPSDPTMPVKKALKIGQTYRLRCVASGANPFPNVTVQSGSTVFTPISNQTYRVRPDVPIPDTINCTTAVTVQFTMNNSFIGRPIVCTAGVKNVNASSYTIIPVADSALAQFQCPDVMKYDATQNSFSMSCQVYGTNLTAFYVKWIDSKMKNISITGTNNVEVQSPDDNHYSLRVTAPSGNNIWWTMTLNVKDAKTVTDLTKNDYHFIVINSYGQTIHTVDVQSDYTADKPTGAAGHLHMSTVGFLAALFCAVAAAIFGRL